MGSRACTAPSNRAGQPSRATKPSSRKPRSRFGQSTHCCLRRRDAVIQCNVVFHGARAPHVSLQRHGATCRHDAVQPNPKRCCADLHVSVRRFAEEQRQFARVAKGVDLRSTAGNCAWVRTPQLTFQFKEIRMFKMMHVQSSCYAFGPASMQYIDMLRAR